MNLSAATTASILLGAISVFAEDGSSILEGAISSKNAATNVSTSNLRRSYNGGCDMYTPCARNKFCKGPDGTCFNSATGESSGVFVKESPPTIQGRCRKKPTISACLDGWDPEVCGCDGNTYVCREEAYRNGVNVDYVGSCESSQSEGRYILNAGSPSRRAITIHSGSCAPGTNVQLFHQLNQDHQKWIYHYDTGAIESVACPGMVLNIEGGSNSNCNDETNIVLWYEEGVEWEKWMYSPEGKLISMYCQNSVIDIFNEDDSNGANIQLFRDTGSDSWNQKWSFESSNREPKNSNNRPPKSSNNRPPKRSKNRPAKRSKSSRTSSSSSSKRSKDFDSFNRVAKSSKSSRGSNDFDLSNVGTAAEVAL